MTCKECKARGDDHYYDSDLKKEFSCCNSCIEIGEVDQDCYKCITTGAGYYLDGEGNWVCSCDECSNGIVEGEK